MLSLIKVYTVCHSQQSDDCLHYLPFSAVRSGSTLFAILSSLIRVYTICHSQSYQGLHFLPFSLVWGERGGSVVECLTPEREVGVSRPTAAVLCPWARHFTPRQYWLITQEALAPSRHDWKIVDWDVKLQHKKKSLVWSRNTLFAILSKQFYQGLHCLQFSADWLASTLFVILNSLISVYTICHSQQSDQGLHRLPFSSIIRVYTIWNSQTDQGLHYLPFSVHHCQQSDRGLQYLPFSAVWSGSTLFAILSKQYYQGIHCLPFSAVWSGSALFAILSKQYYQGLHCLPF